MKAAVPQLSLSQLTAAAAAVLLFQNETPMVTKYIVVSKRAGRISCAESQTAVARSVSSPSSGVENERRNETKRKTF